MNPRGEPSHVFYFMNEGLLTGAKGACGGGAASQKCRGAAFLTGVTFEPPRGLELPLHPPLLGCPEDWQHDHRGGRGIERIDKHRGAYNVLGRGEDTSGTLPNVYETTHRENRTVRENGSHPGTQRDSMTGG